MEQLNYRIAYKGRYLNTRYSIIACPGTYAFSVKSFISKDNYLNASAAERACKMWIKQRVVDIRNSSLLKF